jgi:acetyl esterase
MTRPFVRPDVQMLLDALKANPRPTMTAENLPTLRPMVAAGLALIEPPIGELAVTRDIIMPGPGGEIPLRFLDSRAVREPGPVVVFFHGGGFLVGNPDAYMPMCAEIARRLDLPVVSVDYRLAPENKWPAAADDAEAAARWVAEHGEAFDRKITSLVLCGDSAGGTLTIVTALALRDRPAAVPLIFQFPIYPAADPLGKYPSNEAFGEGYGLDTVDMDIYNRLYDPQPGHWRAAPIVADQSGLPPTLIVTAGLDPLRDQGRAYAAKTIAAGVTTTYREVAGTIHGFLAFRKALPSAQAEFVATLEVAKAMIRESLAGLDARQS